MRACSGGGPQIVGMTRTHTEQHRSQRVGWLRAAVLGANDGVISVASLVVGVASAGSEPRQVLLSGVAGLAAGAMSMAAGEYVSVSSQADAERADLARERRELEREPDRELLELTDIYVNRGLDESLARRVAQQLMSKDALAAHARDELGMTGRSRARPLQAAMASAAAFSVGGSLPVATALLSPAAYVAPVAAATTLFALAGLGATAAYAGGAPLARGAARVVFWGALAMGLTALIGGAFGTFA